MRGDVLAARGARVPVRGLTIPRIVFSVVDFPDALPPSRQTSSPSRTTRFESCEDVDLPVVGVDALELEQRRSEAGSVRVHLRAAPPVPRYASMTRGSVATCLEGSLRDLQAVVESDDPVGDPLDDVHVVLDHENRVAALVAELRDQLGDLVRLLRVHPGGRLVEQQQPRVRRHRPRDLEPAPIGVRERCTPAGPSDSPSSDPRRTRAAPRRARGSRAPRAACPGCAASTAGRRAACGRTPRPSRSLARSC